MIRYLKPPRVEVLYRCEECDEMLIEQEYGYECPICLYSWSTYCQDGEAGDPPVYSYDLVVPALHARFLQELTQMPVIDIEEIPAQPPIYRVLVDGVGLIVCFSKQEAVEEVRRLMAICEDHFRRAKAPAREKEK